MNQYLSPNKIDNSRQFDFEAGSTLKEISTNSYKKCFKIDWSRSSIEALRGAYNDKMFPKLQKLQPPARSQSNLQAA